MGLAGMGSAVLAAGLAFSVQVQPHEARRQLSGGGHPYEVQLTPAPPGQPRDTSRTEEERRQALQEYLHSQRVDARTAWAPPAEVTCAIRIVEPDMDVDPGIYRPVPRTDVEAKVRIVGGSVCLGGRGAAGSVPHYRVETFRAEKKERGGKTEIEVVKPQPPAARR